MTADALEQYRTHLTGRGAGCRGSRLVPDACGSPAFGQYRDGGATPWALVVLEIVGDKIIGYNSFLDVGTLFPRFGLPCGWSSAELLNRRTARTANAAKGVGAILFTGYLGGAIATHVRLENPLFSHILFPLYIAALLWAGLWLRDPRVRTMYSSTRT